MPFTTTAVNVLIMLAYAIPGFVFIKLKTIKPESIGAFAKLLLFVCAPALSINSFYNAEFTPELGKSMIVFFLLSLFLQVAVLGIMYLVFRKKYQKEASYRVCTVATILGNVGFFGVPLLQALLPDNQNNAVLFSAVFIVGMNFISWTLVSTILTGNKKYMSMKKLLINPAMFSLIIALPLFFTNVTLPFQVEKSLSVLSSMTTPLSMLIIGMRLALSDFRELFKDGRVYLVASIKLIALPLLTMGIVYFLPLEQYMKATMIILCCCPTASTVLNLSELYETGRKTAAKLMLTSTLFAIVTIPFLLMFVNVE